MHASYFQKSDKKMKTIISAAKQKQCGKLLQLISLKNLYRYYRHYIW